MVKLLLEHGADANAPDARARPPMALALAEVPFAKQDGARRGARGVTRAAPRGATLAPTPALRRPRATARRGAERRTPLPQAQLGRSLELVVAEAAAHRDDDEPPVWRGLYDADGGHADVGWA